MSEYQYYEFQAIDRPLTEAERAEISKLSSRVALSPRKAVFTYQYGDFRGDPETVLERYFDAMLYQANWGTHQLLFRFPRALVDLRQLELYCVGDGDGIEVERSANYIILNIRFDDEGADEWIEGEGTLSSMLELRNDILRKDYRALYLAWLNAISFEMLNDDTEEPPVPSGLHTLSSALDSFIDFFRIDSQLIEVAARSSDEEESVSDEALQEAIGQLTPPERDEFLSRLARGESNLSIELNARLQEIIGKPRPDPKQRRTVGQLIADAERVREQVRKKREREVELQRIKGLEALAQREKQTWQEVDVLIQKSNAKGYDQAVFLLGRLRDLAVHRHSEAVFQERLNQIHAQYKSRPALMDRLRRMGLNRQDA